MDISIIIINYNTYELTAQCIRSVYEHTFDIQFEIIVVDNASKERNPDDFLKEFPNIKLIKSEKNLGFAKGNNLGIENSLGEFILLLNSDTILVNNVPKILFNYISTHLKCGVVSAQLLYPNKAIQHSCSRFPSISILLFELFRLQKVFPKKGGEYLLGSFFDNQSEVNPDWVWGTCFMFRRSLIELFPNKKLNEDFFMYMEDMQWCFEIRKLGYYIHYLPQAKVIHLLGGSQANSNIHKEENLKIFMNTYYSKLEVHLINFFERLLILSQR